MAKICDSSCGNFTFFMGQYACQRNGPEDPTPGETIYPTRKGDRCYCEVQKEIYSGFVQIDPEPPFKPGDMIKATLKYDVLNIYEGYIVRSDGEMWLAEVVNTSIKSDIIPRPTVLRFAANSLERIDMITSDRAKKAFERISEENVEAPNQAEEVLFVAKSKRKKVAPEEMMVSLF